MNPGISVLIRTFNSARTLPLLLQGLKLLPGDELIVVDSGSTDSTLEIAKKYKARIVTAEEPFHYSRSLNSGFRAASQPWVLVISSHCLPLTPDLLGTFRKAAADFPTNVAVAYGVCSLVDQPTKGDESVIFAGHDASPIQRKGVYGGNGLAFYRRLWWERQPFDETIPTSEDLVWFLASLAQGAIAAKIPEALVLYRNQASLSRMFRKGWMESRMERALFGAPKMTLLGLGINCGALLKKCVLGRIPFSTLLRQGAHVLGVFLSCRSDSEPKVARVEKTEPKGTRRPESLNQPDLDGGHGSA